MRNAQDDTLDKMDSFEEAVLGLNESVADTRDLIMANRALIMANHEHYERQFAEIRAMLEAIIEDQNVPYKPVGFVKD